MKFRQIGIIFLSPAILTSAAFSRAGAATIGSVSTFSTPGFSTGSMGPVGSTPAPNNDDDTGSSPNVIPYNVFFNSPGILETEFVLANSGGTTEYRFTQSFLNNTPTVWTGFRFELGFGTGTSFVLSQLADTLQFDSFENNSTATSTPFALTVDEMKTLGWGGASVPRFSSARFTFAIDVPDDLADANPSGLNRFTLRQTPIVAGSAVPEPATFGLLGLALAGFGLRARYRYARVANTSR
jgi:hypothetical protein